jgi:hypothetical protein
LKKITYNKCNQFHLNVRCKITPSTMCIAKIRVHMKQSQGGPNFGNVATKAWNTSWQTFLFSFLCHDTLRVYGEHYEKNIMWGISNAHKCGHFVFCNAMQVLTLCKNSSNYITNMGKGFLCVGENVFIEAPSNLRVIVP